LPGFGIGYSDEIVMVEDQVGSEGLDSLFDIERLQFSDSNLAFDLDPSEHGGQALEFIGVLAPDLIEDPSVVGLILNFFDQGIGMTDLFQTAININLVTTLAGGSDNDDVARLAFRNVTDMEADQAMVDLLVSFMEGPNAYMSQAEFLATVADLEINKDHIGLVGLQQTGVEYLPV
jgi:hypothetical protein